MYCILTISFKVMYIWSVIYKWSIGIVHAVKTTLLSVKLVALHGEDDK